MTYPTRRAARLGAAGLATLAAILPAATAHAAGGRITQIEASDKQIRLVFTADALPAGVTVDPGSVSVTVGTTHVDATAVPVTGATVQRTAELVIDTSGSMRGEGITGAKAAGLAFVDAVPADVRVGVVTFADTAAARVAPTTDRGRIRRVISGLQPAGETSLYDGVLLGLRELGRNGVRSMLVLSDGADTRSRAQLSAVLSAVSGSDVTVHTVAFKTEEATGRVLQQISAAAGGRSVSAARAGDVGAAFRDTARAISNQLVVTAAVPPGVTGPVTVSVNARAGGQTLTDTAQTTVVAATANPTEAGPEDADVDSGAFASKGVLYGALAALFLGVALILVLAFGTLTSDRPTGRVRRRLSLYTLAGRGTPEPQETTALGDSGVARSAVEFAGRVVKERDLESGIARQLERGGSSLKPAEWLIVHAGCTVGATLLCLLLSGGKVLPAVVGFVLGFTGPYAWLKLRAARRTNAFLAQMPDTLQLLAGSLSAGYSLPQAVDAVVREGSKPISDEFGRAIIESRLGVPVEDALDNIATRMDSRDFAWVVMAVRIQREVGGNLAEVLATVANTMRERERVRRQVKVLSAEGRLSALILGGLPPLFAVYLALVRPTYIKPLFTDPIGILMLVVMGVLFAVGVFWLRKVVQVEV